MSQLPRYTSTRTSSRTRNSHDHRLQVIFYVSPLRQGRNFFSGMYFGKSCQEGITSEILERLHEHGHPHSQKNPLQLVRRLHRALHYIE
jgi:hypothetical protein